MAATKSSVRVGRIKDLTGQRFGRLAVIRLDGRKHGKATWLCRCDCGADRPGVYGNSLVKGSTTSCGCARRETCSRRMKRINTTHGMTYSPEFNTWSSMLDRCQRPNHKSYPQYGGRGITVCERWAKSFADFYADMGPRPSPNHSIDRIDNDGPYAPGNCRWATRDVQAGNTGCNHHLTFRGRTMILADWARETGLSREVLTYRLSRGWSVEKALTAPLRTRDGATPDGGDAPCA
jgi:hypothetical protein